MIDLPGVLSAAAEVQRFCQERGWRFCFIGGVAVQRWGEPRLTQDVDLTLLTGLGGEEGFVDPLLAEFTPRFADARAFALHHRVVLAKTRTGVHLDVALGALPFEERSVCRASGWRIGGAATLITCSAEDLVVHKAFAGRDLDWSDLERILVRQHGKLDLEQVRTELKPLLELKGEPGGLIRLEALVATVTGRLQERS